MDEPNILYEEERIVIEDEVIHIFDHNNIKIVYDSAIHDFFEILKVIGQTCSFFFKVGEHSLSGNSED